MWKTSGFARKFKSGTERFCSPDYAQKMQLLQKRKPGDHCDFRAAWSATGFSFRHPNFLCEINFAGKGNYMLKRKITAFKPYKVPLLPTIKAVLLKNCFVYLNSKNDNSIDCQKSPRSFPFNRLSLLAFQAQRKLSYYVPFCFISSFSLSI